MKPRQIFMYVLGAIIVIGEILLIIRLVPIVLKDPNSPLREVLIMTIASFNTCFGMVVGYFYGSSAGSATKSEIIDKKLNP